jgi:hypothetical protein
MENPLTGCPLGCHPQEAADPAAALTPEESSRLSRAIGQITGASDETERTGSLRIVQNFCEGQPSIIPLLGTAGPFALIPVLVRLLLDSSTALGGVLGLLDCLLRACRANCKAFLRVRGAVEAILTALNSLVDDASSAAVVLPKIGALVTVLLRYRPARRIDSG